MANIKISKKGKALLRRGYAADQVSKEIATHAGKLSAEGSLRIALNGTSLVVKGAKVAVQKP